MYIESIVNCYYVLVFGFRPRAPLKNQCVLLFFFLAYNRNHCNTKCNVFIFNGLSLICCTCELEQSCDEIKSH